MSIGDWDEILHPAGAHIAWLEQKCLKAKLVLIKI